MGGWKWLKHGKRKQGWVYPSIDGIEDPRRNQVNNGVPQQLSKGRELAIPGGCLILGDLVCDSEEDGEGRDSDAGLGESGPDVWFGV